MSEKIRIVLCDDHPIFLAGLRTLVGAEEDFEIVGEATNGLQALSLIRDVQPDIAIVDISMPQLNGILLTSRLASECPSVAVLVLTVYEDRIYGRQALQAGTRGYLLKRSAAENLIHAIHTIRGGGLYIDAAIAGELLSLAKSANKLDMPVAPAKGNITARESSVLKLASKGFTNKEIARQLVLSIKSVETYKFRGLEKLGLKTRADLVRYGSTQGWLADA